MKDEVGLSSGGTNILKYGIFKAGSDTTIECKGYPADDWQDYCSRSFVCLAAIFGFMAMLEFIGRQGGCLRNCVGCCVICAGPGLVFLACSNWVHRSFWIG